jgi:hypothetical protein
MVKRLFPVILQSRPRREADLVSTDGDFVKPLEKREKTTVINNNLVYFPKRSPCIILQPISFKIVVPLPVVPFHPLSVSTRLLETVPEVHGDCR